MNATSTCSECACMIQLSRASCAYCAGNARKTMSKGYTKGGYFSSLFSTIRPLMPLEPRMIKRLFGHHGRVVLASGPLLRSRKRPLVALFLRGLGYMLGLLLFLPELGQQPAQQSGEGTLGIGQGILGGWRTPCRERFGSRGINRIGHRVCLLRL